MKKGFFQKIVEKNRDDHEIFLKKISSAKGICYQIKSYGQ